MGYGDGGAPTWQFRLPLGRKKDIRFFKLYVCTCSTDFSCILQEPVHSEPKIQGGMWRSAGPAELDTCDEGQWGTKLVMIIQVDS